MSEKQTIKNKNEDKRTWRYDDPILGELYQEERSKLSLLPDADSDFEALDKALERYRKM